MREKIKNIGKKFARGRNSKQRYIYGRENINWEGPQRAAEDDAEKQRQDFMDIARDFTETTNAAAVAYEEGDMEAYHVLTEEAAKVYSAHKRWSHFAQSRPEKMEDIRNWQTRYAMFRVLAGLGDDHISATVTERYKIMTYDNEDWENAVEGVRDAIFQYDKIKQARQTYRDRVNGDRRDEETPANPITEKMKEEYSDKGPRLTTEDYSDLNKFFSKVEEINYPRGAVMNIGDDDRANKIMRTMVSWGLCQDQGNGSYSLYGTKEDFHLAAEEVSHRAAGGTPTRPVHGGKYMGEVQGEHSFKERPLPTNNDIREMLVNENTVAIPYGSNLHRLSDEQREKFLLKAISDKDIPCTVTQFQVEETGEIISVSPQSRIASYQKHRSDLASGKKVDSNILMAMYDDGFLPSDYSKSTLNDHYSDGRLLKNPYNTSATVKEEKPRSQPQTETSGGSGGRGGGGGGHNFTPPTEEFPQQPSGSGSGGRSGGERSSGGSTSTKQRPRSKRRNPDNPILQRTTRNIENTMGVSKFGSTRLTGRKRVGPFVVNTGVGGVAGVSSISLNVGPIMWSIWSKNYQSGFSSIDLPGMLSFRGNRKRKK